MTAAPLPPGPTGAESLPLLRRISRDPIPLLGELWRRHGDVARMGLSGPLLTNLVFHPAGAERVLGHNHRGYRKGSHVAQFQVLDGLGLVTSEGELWQRQRRLAQPAFHRRRLDLLAATMAEAAQAAAEERWRARGGEPFDIEPELMRLTLQIAGRTLFQVDVTSETGAISRAVDVAREHITWRIYFPWWPEWLPVSRNRAFREAKGMLDSVVGGIIAERRRTADDRGDLLSMFLLARDEETGAGMDDIQLRDEVMTMLMAGHESTALTITWAFYLLGRHLDAQERARQEVRAALDGRPPAAGDLPRLPYLRMLIEETLRLYPVTWALSRQAAVDDEILGWRIRAGSHVTLPVYWIHRHPEFWADPDRFDPERFAPEHVAARARFAYLPFGGGPRGCIGSHFALMEAQIVLAVALQRFTVELVSPEEPGLEALLYLRPRAGVPVRLRPLPE